LPGVAAATAKKIIAGRPYKTVDDLAKAGVSKATIATITPMAIVGPATATPFAGDEVVRAEPFDDARDRPGRDVGPRRRAPISVRAPATRRRFAEPPGAARRGRAIDCAYFRARSGSTSSRWVPAIVLSQRYQRSVSQITSSEQVPSAYSVFPVAFTFDTK
jgi:hypothetical protein